MKQNEIELLKMLKDEGLQFESVDISDLDLTLENCHVTHVMAMEDWQTKKDSITLWAGNPSSKHSLSWASNNFSDDDNRFDEVCGQILKDF